MTDVKVVQEAVQVVPQVVMNLVLEIVILVKTVKLGVPLVTHVRLDAMVAVKQNAMLA